MSQIIVPGALVEDAAQQWAPISDPVFKLVPAACKEHISTTYAQLGHPVVKFDLFWQVYNQLRDAVDSDVLTSTNEEVLPNDNPESHWQPEDRNRDQLPLSHLQPFEFGANGDPGEQNSFQFSLIYNNPAGLTELPPRLSEEDDGICCLRNLLYSVLTTFQNVTCVLNSQMMKVRWMRCSDS